MKIVYIILFVCLFVNCSSIKTTKYYSSCLLYGKSDVILKINFDSSFVYNFRYNDRKIVGKWKINSDTLILTSDFFYESVDSLSPNIKVSDLYGFDKYLIKSNKLFIINNTGIEKECYLKRN